MIHTNITLTNTNDPHKPNHHCNPQNSNKPHKPNNYHNPSNLNGPHNLILSLHSQQFTRSFAALVIMHTKGQVNITKGHSMSLKVMSPKIIQHHRKLFDITNGHLDTTKDNLTSQIVIQHHKRSSLTSPKGQSTLSNVTRHHQRSLDITKGQLTFFYSHNSHKEQLTLYSHCKKTIIVFSLQ